MPMMQELLRLKNNGSLNEVQKKWFETPKPKEEFYDVLNDPYEINNLINEPQYIDIIDNLRTSLIKWREDSNDLGDIPEMELIPDKYLN